jgi:hypothetical protein
MLKLASTPALGDRHPALLPAESRGMSPVAQPTLITCRVIILTISQELRQERMFPAMTTSRDELPYANVAEHV